MHYKEGLTIKKISKDLKFDIQTKSYGQVTKDRIFEVSIELFSRKGFNAVSIRDIAGEVGIKQSSLYNHFGSKDEILEDIYVYFKIEAAKAFPPLDNLDNIIRNSTPEEFFCKGKELFIEHMLNSTMEKIWRILFIEQTSDQRATNIVLQESFKKTLSFVEIALGKMIALNKIAKINPRICSFEYTYPINFIFFEYIISKSMYTDKDSLEKQIDEHINFFCTVVLNNK